MILKITNDFNLILNKDDYQAFVNAIDLLSLHCPVCGVVGLFILYGHYKRFVIIDDISSGECKIQIPVQRIQCTQCKSTHALLPTNFVPYTQFTYLFIYYIVTLDENDDLITSFDVALQTQSKNAVVFSQTVALTLNSHRSQSQFLPLIDGCLEQ